MNRAELFETYIPQAEAMASRYWRDEDALGRAYLGLAMGIDRLPEGHPNPGGFITQYIKNQLILKPKAVVMLPSGIIFKSFNQGDPPDYLIEEVSENEFEAKVCWLLYEAYSTREIAEQLDVSHNRVVNTRNRLKERLDRVLAE